MKIGIIGAGRVGSTLGKKWLENGHEIHFGVRDKTSAKVKFLVEQIGEKAQFMSTEKIFKEKEIIVLTVPFGAVKDVLDTIEDKTEKIIVDCTNAIPFAKEILEENNAESGAELIASWAEGAKVVKAFNSIGFNIMENPKFDDDVADAYMCGDDITAVRIVAKLAEEIGFRAIDTGKLSNARALEHLAWLWITMSKQRGRNIAFKLLEK